MSILIVLFGQENEADGRLRAPAAARCARAAELWKELSPSSEVVILPTGAFGSHFNTSDEPHFHYLTRDLIGHGVPPENILPGVASSNTVQDATEAWYRFKSGGYQRLIAVTSDYHAARVAFILGQLNVVDNADIAVYPAITPAEYNGLDKRVEEKKLAALKKDWVNVITRNSKVPPERFAAVYENAGRESRHHRALSIVVVAGILAVNGFALAFVPGTSDWLLFLLVLLLAVVDGLLWLLFYRLDRAAHMAMRVVNRMEIEHRMPGFTSNWRGSNAEWFRTVPWTWSLREIVTALTGVLFLTVVITSMFASADRRDDMTPRRTASPTANANVNANASATPLYGGNGNAVDRFANAVVGSQSNANSDDNTNRRRRRR